MGRRKKRTWSDGEKREICQQTMMPGVSVAQIGRRYAVNANLILKWLKDGRFSPEVIEAQADAVFLPVEIDACDDAPGLPSAGPQASGMPTPTPAGRVEIELAGGHRTSAEGRFDPEVLGRLLKGSMA